MKKHLLLASLLTGVLILGAQTGTFAATSADQTVSATLAVQQTVTGKGTGLTGTITPEGGSLSALAPSFTITTNDSGSQTLYLTATAPYDGGNEQAITSYTGHLGTYIVLANTTTGKLATQAAIQDITGGTLTSNANAIGYPLTPQATKTGLTLGTWDGTNHRWPYTLAQAGNTDVDNAISGTPLASSYTTADQSGTYQATVTLGFAP